MRGNPFFETHQHIPGPGTYQGTLMKVRYLRGVPLPILYQHPVVGLGSLAINTAGLSTTYNDVFPPELEGLLSEEEWSDDMGRINR